MAPKQPAKTEPEARGKSLFVEVRVINGRRITLPEPICEEYGLDVGDRLTLVRQPNGWLLTPATAVGVSFVGPDGSTFSVSSRD